MAAILSGGSMLDRLGRHTMHERDIRFALKMLKAQLDQEGIAFAVIGAIAMQEHGYVRHTEGLDIVTTQAGLVQIHQRLVGRGYLPRAEGLRKKLRDTVHSVSIDVITAGDHAGSRDSPIVYPDPASAEFRIDPDSGIAFATLPALVSFKLASGKWGNRLRDLADVEGLIRANSLDEGFAASLPEAVRADYLARLSASRLERDIE